MYLHHYRNFSAIFSEWLEVRYHHHCRYCLFHLSTVHDDVDVKSKVNLEIGENIRTCRCFNRGIFTIAMFGWIIIWMREREKWWDENKTNNEIRTTWIFRLTFVNHRCCCGWFRRRSIRWLFRWRCWTFLLRFFLLISFIIPTFGCISRCFRCFISLFKNKNTRKFFSLSLCRF